jgi:hypothetical protein
MTQRRQEEHDMGFRPVMLSSDPGTHCACGEAFIIEDDRIAHFLDAFVPDDDIGRDGQRHQQVEGDDDAPQCECGAIFAYGDALDSHFEGVFVPLNHQGIDGRVHTGTTLLPVQNWRGIALTTLRIEVGIPVLVRGYCDLRVSRGIRRIRHERGWTLGDVALRLGCDRSRVSRIENGKRGTPVPSLVAEALGVSLEHLLMPCPRCDDKPASGYRCTRCGAEAT